jgi:hypothetical protein
MSRYNQTLPPDMFLWQQRDLVPPYPTSNVLFCFSIFFFGICSINNTFFFLNLNSLFKETSNNNNQQPQNSRNNNNKKYG